MMNAQSTICCNVIIFLLCISKIIVIKILLISMFLLYIKYVYTRRKLIHNELNYTEVIFINKKAKFILMSVKLKFTVLRNFKKSLTLLYSSILH